MSSRKHNTQVSSGKQAAVTPGLSADPTEYLKCEFENAGQIYGTLAQAEPDSQVAQLQKLALALFDRVLYLAKKEVKGDANLAKNPFIKERIDAIDAKVAAAKAGSAKKQNK